MYSDSRIVIDWLNGNPRRYKTFVANRVCSIKKIISSENWHHVATENNPADCASRGILPSKLINHPLWWNGPQFLTNSTAPISNLLAFVNIDVPEMLEMPTNNTDQHNILPRISSLYKMKRVIALCMRFYRCLKLKIKCTDPITANELDEAEKIIIKIVQRETFHTEIESLKTNALSKKSTIICLSPFLDSDQILRVGGRLKNSQLSFNAKHQILIPKSHFVTNLIVREAHIKSLHGGPKLTEATVRQRYWLINAHQIIRNVIKNCVKCTRFRPKVMSQIMADLPASRVEMFVKPFTSCAVDYTGAINYKLASGRGARISKAYISVFVCMSTKAIHLELVTAMTADAFIAAYRRMAARRGIVKHFHSDNGTNFVRANKNLTHLSEIEAEEFMLKIQNELAKNGTIWHFSPAGAPHFNGLAEAAVKTIKTHLIKVIGQTALTFEELATFLYQVEACANSRPLCRLSTDPNDTQMLTPGHFLIGAPLLSPPDENLLETKANWLNRWQLVQRLSQSFWKQFKDEYLNTLQRKAKWASKESEPMMGDVVLIKDENTPSCNWPMAKIVDVHPGDDNLVRVVSVKFRDNIFKRPITKIAPLPKPEIEIEHTINAHIAKLKPTMVEKKINTKKSIGARIANLRAPKHKQSVNILTIITAFLAIVASMSTPIKAQPFSIMKFESPPGLYFEQISTAQMSYTSWRSIVFVDLLAFKADRLAIDTNILSMKELCYKKLTELGSCNSMCTMIENRFKIILEKTELLSSKQNKRFKRAILPFVGDLAEILFGVLGPRSADECARNVRNLLSNDEYLMALLKNHTSVLEVSANILKSHDQQFDLQTKHINDLTALVQKNVDTNQAILVFQSISTFVSQQIDEHERQLNALVDIIIDASTNRVNFNLITPAQMKAQSEIIEENAPGNLVTPDAIDMFKLAEITPFITNDTIFFRVTIPLIKPEKFQIFKIFQVPFMKQTNCVNIKTKHEFIITSIDRQSYQTLSRDQLNSCIKSNTKNLICLHPRHWFTHAHATCEWNLLTHRSSDSCVCVRAASTESWQELDEPNKWLFFLPAQVTLTLICGESVTHHELTDSGILDLHQNCTIRDTMKTIEPHLDINNIENEFVFPRLTNKTLNAMTHEGIPHEELHYFKTNFSKIEEQLKEMHRTNMGSSTNNLSHHTHHYVLVYALLMAMVALTVFVLYHGKRLRTSTNEQLAIPQQPIAAPRRITVSMPHIDQL